MKYILLAAMVVGLGGCAHTTHNVQQGTESMKSVYKDYLSRCSAFPFPDRILVDQCFEFDCHVTKFQQWDSNCNEKEYAAHLIETEPRYFQVRP